MERKSGRWVGLLIAIILGAVMLTVTSEVRAQSKTYTIAFANVDVTTPFAVDVKRGFVEVAKKYANVRLDRRASCRERV